MPTPSTPVISRIAHVALGVSDVEAAVDFYHDILGLDVLERRDGHVYLSSGRSTSFDLELGPYDDGLDHFAFGVRGLEALEEARHRLTEAGVALTDTDAGGEPGLAGGFEFALPDGHVMELVAQSEPRGFITSAEAPSGHHRVTGPAPLEHITLLATDIRASCELVMDHLGFQVTDSWRPSDDEWRNTWVRAGELHHDLAFLMTGASGPDLHHFAFAVPSVVDLVRVSDALAARGMAIDASIGRHIGGNNVFLYFKDPFGNRLEVNADMARIDPAAPPQIRREPAPFDAWRGGRPPTLDAGSPCRDGRRQG